MVLNIWELRMSFSAVLREGQLLEEVRRFRENRLLAYGAAIAAVALATALRTLLSPQLLSGVPFITYFPAIIVATFLGGLRPGLMALALSSATAWLLFVKPAYSWSLDPNAAFSLAFFIMMSLVNIGIVMMLNRAVENAVAHERNIRLLIESAQNGIVVVDLEGRMVLLNPSMERLFGYSRAELMGKNVDMLVPENLAGKHAALRAAYLLKPESRMMGVGRDLSGRKKNGSEFPVEIGMNPVSNNGKTAILATIIDISERKRAQEHQQLLVRELQHRTRNLFAVFQVLASRALGDGRTPRQAKDELNSRIQALARSYDVLAGSAWVGALLSDILKAQLNGFSTRVAIDGCDIVVRPSAAQQFAMITHELATNATKYGALSNSTGQISIQGKTGIVGGVDQFVFSWVETGGARPAATSRKGFGTFVLVDAMQHFADDVSMNVGPDGLVYILTVALGTIDASTRKAKPIEAYSA
jgi:PAS domain S-box-containing protein